MPRLLLAVCTVALLAACGSEPDAPPTGVSEGERQALEDAAEMLEADRLPQGVVPGTETPAPTPQDDAETAPESGA
ncbi:MAG: hypothetical protein RIC51_05575 [Erythrobacter sp.]|uniref:hypothetical protein n=1 Tax=Erythrobacter sp. TaxID=1042 RepID=UPI0032EC6936